MDRPVSQMQSGEVQSLIRSNSTSGVKLKIASNEGAVREVTVKDEAIYPLVEDHIPLAP